MDTRNEWNGEEALEALRIMQIASVIHPYFTKESAAEYVKHYIRQAHSEYTLLESKYKEAQANAEFWERELNDFRRNAEHRARQMADEVLRGDVEPLIKPWRELAESYAAAQTPPMICLDPHLKSRAEEAERKLAVAQSEIEKLKRALEKNAAK
jgi:hypothetical protein